MSRQSKLEQNFVIVTVGLTLGFLIAIQVKTLLSQQLSSGTMRASVLMEQLFNAQGQIQKLHDEVDKLREQVREYEQAMAEGKIAAERLMVELDRLRVMAGLTRVRGLGIIVLLTDAPKSGEDALNSGIVHDTDLLMLVNELRAAGAEAIAINDQRVVATTAIRCVGNLITVNSVTISPPYEVAAIGAPDKLEKALTMPKGFVEELSRTGILIRITKHSDLIVPSLSVTPKLEFVRPIKSD